MLQISWKFLGVGTSWYSRLLPSQTVLWFYEIMIAWWIWETCQPMLHPLHEKGHTNWFSCLMWNIKNIWFTLGNSPFLSVPPDEPTVMGKAARAAPGLQTGKVVAVCLAYLEQVSSFLHPLEFTINAAQGNAHSNESWDLWRTNMQHFTHPAFLIWLLLSAFGVALISWDF